MQPFGLTANQIALLPAVLAVLQRSKIHRQFWIFLDKLGTLGEGLICPLDAVLPTQPEPGAVC